MSTKVPGEVVSVLLGEAVSSDGASGDEVEGRGETGIPGLLVLSGEAREKDMN